MPFLFINIVLAQYTNLSNKKNHVNYAKNLVILQKKEYLQDQAKLHSAKSQNKRLTARIEQLIAENKRLQTVNTMQQHWEHKMIDRLLKNFQDKLDDINQIEEELSLTTINVKNLYERYVNIILNQT